MGTFANTINNVLGLFSPKYALNRQVHQMRRESLRRLDAARRDRLARPDRLTNESADLMLMHDAVRARNAARQLMQNNSFAKSALQGIVSNVVGQGIFPEANIQSLSEDRNDAITQQFMDWAARADITNAAHFGEIQATVLSEVIESGECMVHWVADSTNRRQVSFALEMVESERIAEMPMLNFAGSLPAGHQLRRGVEIDANGRPVNYWLYPMGGAPGDILPAPEPKPHKAEEFVHLFRRDRIGQTRGSTWLAPVVWWLQDVRTYVQNEMQTAAVTSNLAMVTKTIDGGPLDGMMGPPGEDGVDAHGTTYVDHDGPILAHIGTNEEFEIVDPTGRPNSGADIWIKLMLRAIAVGLGISYELLSRDYSQTDFSSNRASALEDRRRFRMLQDFMIWRLCQPTYERWFEAAVLAGQPGMPTPSQFARNRDDWLRVIWQRPGWEWVDPLNEARAAEIEIANGLASRQDKIAAKGTTKPREVVEKLSYEEKTYKQLGVPLKSPNKEEKEEAVNEQQKKGKAKQGAKRGLLLP